MYEFIRVCYGKVSVSQTVSHCYVLHASALADAFFVCERNIYMIKGSIFEPKDKEEKFFDTKEEYIAYANEMKKQEILERFGKAIEHLASFYEYAREEDITSFLCHAFCCCLEASMQINIIKSKCDYDGAFEK